MTDQTASPEIVDAVPPPTAKTRRKWNANTVGCTILTLLVTSPCWLILFSVFGSVALGEIEVWRLDQRVHDSRIPGHVVSKQGTGDHWEARYHFSNFIEWEIVTDHPAELGSFVNSLGLPSDVDVDFKDEGKPTTEQLERAHHSGSEDHRLFRLQVGYARSLHPWEIGD
jgi:hypothetical protein